MEPECFTDEQRDEMLKNKQRGGEDPSGRPDPMTLIEAAEQASEQPHDGLLDVEWTRIVETIEAAKSLQNGCPGNHGIMRDNGSDFCRLCGKDLR